MANDTKHTVITGIHPMSGLPYIAEPTDIDQWPSAAANEEAVATLVEIVNRGFSGLKLESYALSDGRMGINYFTDDSTPEGRMAGLLMALASLGKSLPVTESMAILDRIYCEQGLPLPTKKKPGA
jgi:hypothetical protein